MIFVRTLTPADVPACATIFEAAYPDAFAESPRRIGATEFAAETDDELVLVATNGARVCGFASLYVPESFLHHLYVDPASYRRGIGSALLREAMTRASGRLSLKCQHSNGRARNFYARHGFIEGEHGANSYGPWLRLMAP